MNCETTNAVREVSDNERFILPSLSSKMRKLAHLAASASASASVSV